MKYTNEKILSLPLCIPVAIVCRSKDTRIGRLKSVSRTIQFAILQVSAPQGVRRVWLGRRKIMHHMAYTIYVSVPFLVFVCGLAKSDTTRLLVPR